MARGSNIANWPELVTTCVAYKLVLQWNLSIQANTSPQYVDLLDTNFRTRVHNLKHTEFYAPVAKVIYLIHMVITTLSSYESQRSSVLLGSCFIRAWTW
jgi:hypothetical protein